MIDNRFSKKCNHEIDVSLQEITDTEILLNFQKAIVSLYPHLIPIHAFSYDAWDSIVEPLFYEMVYNTFTFKYGIDIKNNETHAYEFTLNTYKGINHIECIPKNDKFYVLINGEWVVQNKDNEKALIFKSFGDGVHWLSSGLNVEKAHLVKFDLVEVDLVCAKTRQNTYSSFYVKKEELFFEFVAESFDESVHN